MPNLTASQQRLAIEAEGWLDLRLPDEALPRIDRLLGSPLARPVALQLRVRAFVEMSRYEDALRDLEELGGYEHDPEWLDLTEAWCRKRTDDLDGAIGCMRRLIDRNPRSAIGHFNLGCYLALSGLTEEALDEVSVACGIDAAFRRLAADERDLVSLRDDGRFRDLVG